MPRAPVQRYEIRTVFRAPLAFAYRWCTDYSPKDPQLEGEESTRKVLQKEPRRVVYEDLEETPEGWMWSRWVVTLRPPDRWHGEAVGNYRTWSADYALAPLPDGRTAFRFEGERRPSGLGERNPPKAQMERQLRSMWRELGHALEADYRRFRKRVDRKPASRR
jgi:2-polyprenyl-6-methoxyphenol hydroxylase-like FAD-dependent oxidoreductase